MIVEPGQFPAARARPNRSGCSDSVTMDAVATFESRDAPIAIAVVGGIGVTPRRAGRAEQVAVEHDNWVRVSLSTASPATVAGPRP